MRLDVGPVLSLADLVAEAGPNRLIVCLLGGIFSGAETYDVGVARVLYSRE